MPLTRRLAALRRSKRFAAYMKARKANRFAETWHHTAPADADPVTVAKRIRKARGGKPDPLARFTPELRRGFSSDAVRSLYGKVGRFDVVVTLAYDDEAAGMACHRPKGRKDALHVEPYGDFVKGSSLTRAEQARAGYVGQEYDRGSIFHDSHVYFVGDASYGNDFESLYRYARERGMAKGPAFRAAQTETDNLARRAWNIAKGDGDVTFYRIRATASIGDVELGSASCGGCEYDDPDACIADHAADMVAEAVHEAESNAAKVARRAKRRA